MADPNFESEYRLGDSDNDILRKILRALRSLVTGAISIVTTDSSGDDGGVFENGTDARTGDWRAIQIVQDAVFASYTSSNVTGDSLVGVSLPAGLIIYGRFTAFTLTSGAVIAYNA